MCYDVINVYSCETASKEIEVFFFFSPHNSETERRQSARAESTHKGVN